MRKLNKQILEYWFLYVQKPWFISKVELKTQDLGWSSRNDIDLQNFINLTLVFIWLDQNIVKNKT